MTGVRTEKFARTRLNMAYSIREIPYRFGFMLNETEVEIITLDDVLNNFKIGDVYLVRSDNVANLGDHYIIIDGGLEQKPHGLRPKNITVRIPAEEKTIISNNRKSFIVLKLNEYSTRRFLNYYNLTL